MLSILIPVYNTDINKLVESLIASAEVATIRYQIIVLDDGSEEYFQNANQAIAQHFNVSYITLTENIGRAKIRNKLAQLAAYPWLLFLDCDSLLVNEMNFILNYVNRMNESRIISGGRIYMKNDYPNFAVHYNYGCKIESKSAKSRSKTPYESFHSNNFLINTDVFNQLKFNEEISGYGYEDLEFAHRVNLLNIEIIHIDNPVVHNSLENNTNFLQKTYNSLKNLHNLYTKNSITPTKLIKTYQLLKPIISIIPWKDAMIDQLVIKLENGKYSTFRLQLLKLFWFDKISMERKT